MQMLRQGIDLMVGLQMRLALARHCLPLQADTNMCLVLLEIGCSMQNSQQLTIQSLTISMVEVGYHHSLQQHLIRLLQA